MFNRLSLSTCVLLLALTGSVASSALGSPMSRELSFYHTHTQERLTVEYYRDGAWDALAFGLLWMREHVRTALEAFLEDVFAAYWAVELDPADVAAVAEHVGKHGGDAEAFTAWARADGPAAAEAIGPSPAFR